MLVPSTFFQTKTVYVFGLFRTGAGADKIDHMKRSLQSILGMKEVQAACLCRADGKKGVFSS